ncbi:MAG: hypothetical protein HY748_01335 [Elusimicrobia bacterium]|nr:hypothetical protein [Elusimicrobiota bacterium]
MIRLLGLRWLFLVAGFALLVRFLLFSRSAGGFAVAVGCFLVWSALSRLKARSLDSPRPR